MEIHETGNGKDPSKTDAASLSSELAVLSQQQFEALLKESYVKMSQEEAEEYDKRRLRIRKIHELLAQMRRKVH